MMNHLRVSHEFDFTDIVLDNPETQNRFIIADMKALIQTLQEATELSSPFLVIRSCTDFCLG